MYHWRCCSPSFDQSNFPCPSFSTRPPWPRRICPSPLHECHGHLPHCFPSLVHLPRHFRFSASNRRRHHTPCNDAHHRERIPLPFIPTHLRRALCHPEPRRSDPCRHGRPNLCKQFICPFQIAPEHVDDVSLSQGIAPTLIILRVGLGISPEQTSGTAVSTNIKWIVRRGEDLGTSATGYTDGLATNTDYEGMKESELLAPENHNHDTELKVVQYGHSDRTDSIPTPV